MWPSFNPGTEQSETEMINRAFFILLLTASGLLQAQEKSFGRFLTDSTMKSASVTFCIIDADSGKTVFSYNDLKSLVPASVLKLVTSSAALEMLGPDYRFHTSIAYTGVINRHSGKLAGNIIIKGGGDPVLGSKRFDGYYSGFMDKWVEKIKELRIRKISGQIITDDSYYDYRPVPDKWLWEDEGNYYGAGAYGLSLFDNSYEVHLKSAYDGQKPVITGIFPPECMIVLENRLVTADNSDGGTVFTAPYSTYGWLAGSIPPGSDDFVLKASINDPPLLMASMFNRKLQSAGVIISGKPVTSRQLKSWPDGNNITVDDVLSPPLRDIAAVMNHESINMYAEHIVKELGKVFRNQGTTGAGIDVIDGFLSKAGISHSGVFIEDGSGLSPLNAISAREVTDLLFYMKRKGKYFSDFYSSLPQAGSEGTLKNFFTDPVFGNSMRAKSGSMTRVRSYAGYVTAKSGKNLIFCIIINNFDGQPTGIVQEIEEIMKETVQNN